MSNCDLNINASEFVPTNFDIPNNKLDNFGDNSNYNNFFALDHRYHQFKSGKDLPPRLANNNTNKK